MHLTQFATGACAGSILLLLGACAHGVGFGFDESNLLVEEGGASPVPEAATPESSATGPSSHSEIPGIGPGSDGTIHDEDAATIELGQDVSPGTAPAADASAAAVPAVETVGDQAPPEGPAPLDDGATDAEADVADTGATTSASPAAAPTSSAPAAPTAPTATTTPTATTGPTVPAPTSSATASPPPAAPTATSPPAAPPTTTTPPAEAGAPSTEADAEATSCQPSSCSNLCVPYFVQCCKSDNTCGCSLFFPPGPCE